MREYEARATELSEQGNKEYELAVLATELLKDSGFKYNGQAKPEDAERNRDINLQNRFEGKMRTGAFCGQKGK